MQAFEAVQGLQDFINKGYYEMVKRDERDVKDALMLLADSRTVKDV